MGDPLLYRPEEAAQALGVSRATLYRLISAEKIATVSIGRARRITRGALEDYVANLAGTDAA